MNLDPDPVNPDPDPALQVNMDPDQKLDKIQLKNIYIC